MRIPKKLHYIWVGGKPLTPMAEMCIASWKNILPEYEFRKWDESNAPIETVPFTKGAYNAQKWAFVVDHIRWYALNTEGGVYLDTDTLILKPLDRFLDHDCFLGMERPGIASCGIIGAVQNHPFTQAMVGHYESLVWDSGNLVTSPRHTSAILKKHGMTDENVLQEVFGVHIYPVDVFYPYPFDNRCDNNYKAYATHDTHAMHLWAFSWG